MSQWLVGGWLGSLGWLGWLGRQQAFVWGGGGGALLSCPTGPPSLVEVLACDSLACCSLSPSDFFLCFLVSDTRWFKALKGRFKVDLDQQREVKGDGRKSQDSVTVGICRLPVGQDASSARKPFLLRHVLKENQKGGLVRAEHTEWPSAEVHLEERPLWVCLHWSSFVSFHDLF